MDCPRSLRVQQGTNERLKPGEAGGHSGRRRSERVFRKEGYGTKKAVKDLVVAEADIPNRAPHMFSTRVLIFPTGEVFFPMRRTSHCPYLQQSPQCPQIGKCNRDSWHCFQDLSTTSEKSLKRSVLQGLVLFTMARLQN